MVKRYLYQITVERPDIAAVCKPTGMTCTEIVWQEFVLASDYAALEAENANLRAGSALLLEDLDRRDSTVGLLQAENAKLRAELERRAVEFGK